MENNEQQTINAFALLRKQFDLNNVNYFNKEIITKGFIKEEFYDKFTLHYKQWWKINKVIKMKREQTVSYPNGNCDIERTTHKHTEEAILLLALLADLGVPFV